MASARPRTFGCKREPELLLPGVRAERDRAMSLPAELVNESYESASFAVDDATLISFTAAAGKMPRFLPMDPVHHGSSSA
mmetsp:Transcript_4048/g.13182  ORF Transcript_4048/g.13182 Transcript_4048/m.13182 type:complete len:80 (-) Transcript_4048:467-706(-)